MAPPLTWREFVAPKRGVICVVFLVSRLPSSRRVGSRSRSVVVLAVFPGGCAAFLVSVAAGLLPLSVGSALAAALLWASVRLLRRALPVGLRAGVVVARASARLLRLVGWSRCGRAALVAVGRACPLGVGVPFAAAASRRHERRRRRRRRSCDSAESGSAFSSSRKFKKGGVLMYYAEYIARARARARRQREAFRSGERDRIVRFLEWLEVEHGRTSTDGLTQTEINRLYQDYQEDCIHMGFTEWERAAYVGASPFYDLFG